MNIVQLDKWTLIAVDQKVANHVVGIASDRTDMSDDDAVDSGW